MAALLIMSLLRIIFTISLALEQLLTDFLIGLQENKHTLAGPWETQFQVVDVVGWSWGQKGEGPGIW